MTSPDNKKTPATKASRRSNRPKVRTSPPSQVPTAPASDSTLPSRSREGPGESLSGPDRPVVLAVIIGPHGVAGEVRLKLFTDDLSRYRAFNAGALTMKSLRDGSNGAIARFAEIPDRNTAERVRGTELTVPRGELPPLEDGEYYHADLIGLLCETDAGEPLGHVAAVENFGAGDILEIEKPGGKRFMAPITAATIGEVVVIDPAFVE